VGQTGLFAKLCVIMSQRIGGHLAPAGRGRGADMADLDGARKTAHEAGLIAGRFMLCVCVVVVYVLMTWFFNALNILGGGLSS
jgi:hypothetical protein